MSVKGRCSQDINLFANEPYALPGINLQVTTVRIFPIITHPCQLSWNSAVFATQSLASRLLSPQITFVTPLHHNEYPHTFANTEFPHVFVFGHYSNWIN